MACARCRPAPVIPLDGRSLKSLGIIEHGQDLGWFGYVQGSGPKTPPPTVLSLDGGLDLLVTEMVMEA